MRGYINRPRLTAERFLDHPFSAEPGARVYRTGDVCRWLPDGNLEFLGRQDDQVKVRGFRVELGEIEAALKHHSDVRQAVVLLRKEQGEKRLVAFVVVSPSQPPTVGELREFLKTQLPEYMIPSLFVLLDALPLSPHGKVDRQALSLMSLESCRSSVAAVGPRNDLERELVEIWRQVLVSDSIGVADNFFELGGHSLLGVRMVALIERRLHKRIPVDLLFQAPTIEQLAAWIHQQQSDEPQPLVVPLQSEGARPPFFAVPPSLSPAIVYAPLAQALGGEQPFYGLVPPPPDPSGMPVKWIETTAAQFIDEMRQIQPRGPYYLGGRCYGGFLAFRMAQQLIRGGDQVALLAMLDVGPPLVRKLNFHLSRLRYGIEMSIRNLREWFLGNDPIEYVVIPFHPIHYDIVPIQDRYTASDDALLWTRS